MDNCTIDLTDYTVYNKCDVERIVTEAVNKAIEQYEAQRTNLENRISNYSDSLFDVLTVPQLAELLHVSKPVAYDLVNAEGFPSFKVGKSIRIYKNDLQDWIATQTTSKKGVHYVKAIK